MSLLPTNVYSGYQGNPANGPTTTPALQPDLGSLLYCSTISTNHITLDGNGLDTTGSGGTASLLLNGIAIASASGLTSTIANWALYPAISTITYATGGGSGGALIMSNVSSLTSQAGVSKVTALTVSTLNGQSIPQLGQTVSYRGNSYLSTNRINVDNKVSTLFTFSNYVGPTCQGYIDVTFQGNVNSSNDGTIPISALYVTDANSGYGFGSAVVPQPVDFSLFGAGVPAGNGSNAVATNAQIPFCFSNAGATLSLILSETALNSEGFTPLYAWTAGGVSVSTNWFCLQSGASISNNP
jgi:hypothetical protein